MTGYIYIGLRTDEDALQFDGYDGVKSAARYADMIETAAKKSYPDAQITVRADQVRTVVESGDEWIDQKILAIIDQVWQSWEWLTP